MPAARPASTSTAEPESVTARMTAFFTCPGGSSSLMACPGVVSAVLLLILAVGSSRPMMRLPDSRISSSGTLNVSPKMLLNRRAIERVISTCCCWSSPTGTASAS